QAFGFGHYFASKREIAEHYRRRLSAGAPTFEKDGRQIGYDEAIAEYFKPGRIVRGWGGADKVLQFDPGEDGKWSVAVVGVYADGRTRTAERPRVHRTRPDTEVLASVLEEDGWKRREPGALYEAEIPEESELLD